MAAQIIHLQFPDGVPMRSETSPLAPAGDHGDDFDRAEMRDDPVMFAQRHRPVDIVELTARPATVEAWADTSDVRLIEFVVERYHRPLRVELARLVGLAERVADDARDASHDRVHVLVRDLAALLVEHLDEEEQDLFPAIVAGDLERAGVESLAAAAVDDHRVVSRFLDELRGLCCDLVDPRPLRRALSWGILNLERELLAHIQLELAVLVPRLQVSLRQWRPTAAVAHSNA
jgi:iron-sulfur cluster repair protein YtfE (RIC family)